MSGEGGVDCGLLARVPQGHEQRKKKKTLRLTLSPLINLNGLT